MGFHIEDGKGSGRRVAVNPDNRLEVHAIQVTEGHHINQDNEKNWSLPFEGLNPTAADDYVFYIQNTGDSDLFIADFRISADTAATQVEVHGVTGTAVGGNTLTPVNKTVGASPTPAAIIETGVDITGLTSAGIIYFIQCAVVNTEYHLRISSKIRIPKGKAVAISVETGTANITGVVSLYESE
jgi:hypothetical protein